MKTAYELAMERLEKSSGPTKKLTDDQKERIAEIERVYSAKIAELRLSYEAKLGAVESYEEAETLNSVLAEGIGSLEAQRDKEKDAIWDGNA